MATLVTIDPGLRCCGVAVFDLDAKRLIGATLALNREKKLRGLAAWRELAVDVQLYVSVATKAARVDEVVVECPQVYTAGKSRGDPNDLIEIAGVAARIAGALGAKKESSVLPRQWKGTLDGDDMVERIKGRLDAKEHAAVWVPSAKSLAHNVYDAIGIGLHVLGRLEPRKVFPR